MGLDTVELVLEAEKRFHIRIPDELAAHTETVGEFAALIYDLRAEAGALDSYDEVLLKLREMVSRQFGIPLERVMPESHFVHDLRLD